MGIAIQVEMNRNEVDREWLDLILMAYEMGITADEIRSFLHKTSTSVHQLEFDFMN